MAIAGPRVGLSGEILRDVSTASSWRFRSSVSATHPFVAGMIGLGSLVCPPLSLSSHVTTTPKTTVADPEPQFPSRNPSLVKQGLQAWGAMPGLKIEMSSNITETRDGRDRMIQQDARAWAKITAINYTTALRQLESPWAQGFLGERVCARQLIETLDTHELVGADEVGFVLGEDGYYADTAWDFNGRTDFIELALLVEFLRMFTPVTVGKKCDVSSYDLKRTAEDFLGKYLTSASYVTNGRLIWAAGALGIPMDKPEGFTKNLMIGISEREHDYVKRMVCAGQTKPQAHHHRPIGLTHLQSALDQCLAGEPVTNRWVQPLRAIESFMFHEWLLRQIPRDDTVGHLADDYSVGIHGGDHPIARTPAELQKIVSGVRTTYDAHHYAVVAGNEWFEDLYSTNSLTREGDATFRTPSISSRTEELRGKDAGAGVRIRLEYLCPCECEQGRIVETLYTAPDSREFDVRMDCDSCRPHFRFVGAHLFGGWRLEEVDLDLNPEDSTPTTTVE